MSTDKESESISQKKQRLRIRVWDELRNHALPDSRFHWNFADFIPDFDGSVVCADKIRSMDEYQKGAILFITPDNCLELLRRYAIEDQKTLLLSTYGIRRGFLLLKPGDVSAGDERLAATLDGVERFARSASLNEMRALGRIDLLVTGASIITTRGIRWGKGHGFFDLEWAIFRELDIVHEGTPIFAVGHDCQVIDLEVPVSAYDTVVSRIVTPNRVMDVLAKYNKPRGILWGSLPAELRDSIPPLVELWEHRRTENRVA